MFQLLKFSYIISIITLFLVLVVYLIGLDSVVLYRDSFIIIRSGQPLLVSDTLEKRKRTNDSDEYDISTGTPTEVTI